MYLFMFIHITNGVFAKEIKYSVSIICDTHMAIVCVGDLTNKQSMKYFELKYICLFVAKYTSHKQN